MSTKTLYERLGGYDAIVAVSGDLLPPDVGFTAETFLGTSRTGRHRPRKATPDQFSLCEFGWSHVLHRARHEDLSSRDEDQ